VFICHASEDKPEARRLREELLRRNVDPWLDEKDLFAGQDWDMAIQEAIRRSDAILILLSRRSVSKRGYIQKEIRKVLEAAEHVPEGRPFAIPIRLEDVELPQSLRRWQSIDYRAENFYHSLVKGISQAAGVA